MQKKILLIDPSITVQKVVSLTLDRSRYQLFFAKTRIEALQSIYDAKPNLILVSDQIAEISASSFPKEIEVWASQKGIHVLPPIVLISAQENPPSKNYTAVLKKPFTPQSLQMLVADQLRQTEEEHFLNSSPQEDSGFQNRMGAAFSNELDLVNETLASRVESAQQEESGSKTWISPEPIAAPSAQAVTAATSNLWSLQDMSKGAAEVEKQIGGQDLQKMVEMAVNRLVPPIVERLVKERLDALLKEQETFLELKT